MPKRKTREEFIKDSIEIHGNKFDYSNVVYVNAQTHVNIICKIHGQFSIKPCNHINQKQGCAKCAGNTKITTSEFKKKAREVHGDLYNYDKVEYTTSHEKVTITCKIHGDFKQQGYVHLQAHGCPACGLISAGLKNLDNQDIWSYRGWGEAGKSSAYFQEYSLYVIKCWKDGEVFYKIGKTFMTLNRRFSGNKTMPYEWKLLTKVVGSSGYISELERKLHNNLKDYRYEPTVVFNGSHECYTESILKQVNTLIKDNI